MVGAGSGGWHLPLLDLKCGCGHRWHGLSTVADGQMDACPACGGPAVRDYQPSRAYGGSRGTHEDDPRDLDPNTRQALLENRAWQEDCILSGDRNTGVYEVKENGPSWSRPFGNDPDKRRRAIEERGYSRDGY